MQINHLIQHVNGPFDTTNGKLVCVKSPKHTSVELCMRSDDGWNVPFAEIKLHSRDRYIDAKAIFQDACNLGDEIVKRWNASQGVVPLEPTA